MSNKISIIIPVYNVEEYLRECLDSVVNQSFKDIEIICINDGSTDNSYKILEEYSKTYDNFKIINQSNKGLSTARNEGLKIAMGEYVYFIDADDVLKENALDIIWNNCKQKHPDVLFFSFENFSDSQSLKNRFEDKFKGKKRNSICLNKMSGKDLLNFFCKNNEYYVNVWIQVLRREFLLKNKITFYDGIIYEDNLYTLKVLLEARSAYCTNDILYAKRIRENSIVTKKQDSESVRGLLVTICEIIKITQKDRYVDGVYESMLFIINNLINNCRKKYFSLDDTEKNKLLEKITLYQRTILDIIVLTN